MSRTKYMDLKAQLVTCEESVKHPTSFWKYTKNKSRYALITFFFWCEDCNFIQITETNTESWMRACSIRQEFSSIHTKESSMLRACFAKRWVGLFPCLLTSETVTKRNSVQKIFIPRISEATVEGIWDRPQRARTITNESPSRTNSWIPVSLANWKPASKAFASECNGPKGAWILLLKVATTLPLSSQITTPTPIEPWCLDIAPSTLILNRAEDGGVQLELSSSRITSVEHVATE